MKCNIRELKYQNGENVGGLMEKLMYNKENPIVTDVLDDFKLNFIE